MPEHIDVPRVVDIDLKPLHLLGYPLAMVLLEKIVTAIDRGETNTRWRDYADVYAIIRRHVVDANQLAISLSEVGAHRSIELRTLLPRGNRFLRRRRACSGTRQEARGREHTCVMSRVEMNRPVFLEA